MPGLEDHSREIILDHNRNPRNRGELPVPPAHRVEGFNPLCGDEIVLYLDVEGGTVTDVRIGGQGCSISQSSASMMSAAVKGKTLDEVKALTRAFKAMMSIHEQSLDGETEEPKEPAEIAAEEGVKLGDLEALRGVVKFPVRIKCATLSWNILLQGLEEAAETAYASPRAASIALASFTSRSVISPLSWLTRSMTTLFHELDQSGWWSAFSASRATIAMKPKASTKLANSSSRWSFPSTTLQSGRSS
jgi:nitrogen fixation NifU-like protein